MEIGRKVVNIRLDRGLPQQDLAKACGMTGGALSTIENGLHGPRGWGLFRIARTLAVPCDYLVDENLPYPYEPMKWRDGVKDADRKVRMRVTREEKAFLEALRRAPREAREAAYAVPEATLEQLWVVARVLLSGGKLDREQRRRIREVVGRA